MREFRSTRNGTPLSAGEISAVRGCYKSESVLDCLETSRGTQRACFHLRELILAVRREACWIKGAFRKLKYPDVFAVRFVRFGFRHERRVDWRHRCEIRKSVDLVHGLGHGRIKKVHVVCEDNHKINFRRIGSRTDVGEQSFPVLNNPLRLAGRQAVRGKINTFPGTPRSTPKSTVRKVGRFHSAPGLHVPSRKFTAQVIRCCGFATINLCRSANAQAALSGGSSRESLLSLFLRITASIATTELQS